MTCVDKSNVLGSFAFFREVFDEVPPNYPDIEAEHLYADAAAQALVMRPQHFDVLVMENFLGDILSDLGGGTIGGIGLCASGNIGDTTPTSSRCTAPRPTSPARTSPTRSRRSSPRR